MPDPQPATATFFASRRLALWERGAARGMRPGWLMASENVNLKGPGRPRAPAPGCCPGQAQIFSTVLRTDHAASTMKPASQARMIATLPIGMVPWLITSVPILVIW